MKVLLYCHPDLVQRKHLIERIKSRVDRNQLEQCENLEMLSKRLRQPKLDLSIIILAASNEKELYEFIRLENRLSEFRVILILPDHSEKTISLGLKIYPRYTGFLYSDFTDICLVLEKMLNKSGSDFEAQL